MSTSWTFDVEHISASCNSFSGAVEWNDRCHLLSFASGQYLMLASDLPNSSIFLDTCCHEVAHFADIVTHRNTDADEEYEHLASPIAHHSLRIVRSYSPHSGRVQCVRWLTAAPGVITVASDCLLTADTSSVYLWRIDNQCLARANVEFLRMRNASNQPITHVDGILGDHSITIVSVSADSAVCVWLDGVCVQTINMAHTIVLSVCCFCFISAARTCGLLLATSDCVINLHVMEQGASRFAVKPAVRLRGHTDWSTDMHVCHYADDTLLVASASMDTTVRIWAVCALDHTQQTTAPVATTAAADFSCPLEMESHRFQVPCCVDGSPRALSYYCRLHAVLCGHDSCVHSVRWSFTHNAHSCQLFLLSAGLQCIVWGNDFGASGDIHANGSWTELARAHGVLCAGGQESTSAVLRTSIWLASRISSSNDSGTQSTILAVDLNGAFYVWTLSTTPCADSESRLLNSASIQCVRTFNGGHFGAVNDICWLECAPDVYALLTCGDDQSTRVYMAGIASGTEEPLWREVSRAQMHGYEVRGIAALHDNAFVSISDEKIVRIFHMPSRLRQALTVFVRHECVWKSFRCFTSNTVVDALGLTNRIQVDEEDVTNDVNDQPPFSQSAQSQLTCVATNDGERENGGDKDVNQLSSSVKAVMDTTTGIDGLSPADISNRSKSISTADVNDMCIVDSSTKPVDADCMNGSSLNYSPVAANEMGDGHRSSGCPLEQELAGRTLWPEACKLYSHVFELICVAVGGEWMASASKASAPSNAAIVMWRANRAASCADTEWSEWQSLQCHRLTVVQMCFATHPEPLAVARGSRGPILRLLSVSRDRTWAVHVCDSADASHTTWRLAQTGSGHTRIIWACRWLHGDSGTFVTGSRDMYVKLWRAAEDVQEWSEFGAQYRASAAVTALETAPTASTAIVVAGLESGAIIVLQFDWQRSLTVLFHIAVGVAHIATVKRLLFQPCAKQMGKCFRRRLASCSVDGSVKIFQIFSKCP